MFTKFRVRNFKTHLDTEIELKDLTLLIGFNNSGKTNLLKAISFFSEICRNATYSSNDFAKLRLLDNEESIIDYTHCRKYIHHSQSAVNPTIFNCEWISNNDEDFRISYELEILPDAMFFPIREKIYFGKNNDRRNIHSSSKEISIWKQIKENNTIEEDYKLCFFSFWEDLISIKYFFLQTNSLKSKSRSNISFFKKEQSLLSKGIEDKQLYRFLNLSTMLKEAGEDFLESVKYIKATQSEQYDRFIFYLKRFEPSFVGINTEYDEIKWQFDVGKEKLVNYTSASISNGLLKAAIIALLCFSKNQPSITILDEIENSLDQYKLVELIEWLRYSSNQGKNTQFILTSHSPFVIREFSDNLDSVYTVHLKRKKGYVSEVTNLNEELKAINRLGGLREEGVEEIEGVLHIRKYVLTELFHNGILG